MLQIRDLLKKYGDKTILDVKALTIPPGITHLKGINGSGKTTFSKIIAGLIPYQGEVVLNESLDPSTNKAKKEKKVNYAGSEPLFPEVFTANDLIAFIAKAKGASMEDKTTITELFGVNEYLFDVIGTYSSGMLKRLSLCLAFLGSPALILLDEPFNTLDVDAIELLKNLIHDQREKGINFILVSHQDVQQLGVNVDASFLVQHHNIRAI